MEYFRASALVAITCLLVNLAGCAGVQFGTKADDDSVWDKERAKLAKKSLPARLFGWPFLSLAEYVLGPSKDESFEQRETRKKIEKQAEVVGEEYEKAMDSLKPKDKYSEDQGRSNSR